MPKADGAGIAAPYRWLNKRFDQRQHHQMRGHAISQFDLAHFVRRLCERPDRFRRRENREISDRAGDGPVYGPWRRTVSVPGKDRRSNAAPAAWRPCPTVPAAAIRPARRYSHRRDVAAEATAATATCSSWAKEPVTPAGHSGAPDGLRHGTGGTAEPGQQLPADDARRRWRAADEAKLSTALPPRAGPARRRARSGDGRPNARRGQRFDRPRQHGSTGSVVSRVSAAPSCCRQVRARAARRAGRAMGDTIPPPRRQRKIPAAPRGSPLAPRPARPTAHAACCGDTAWRGLPRQQPCGSAPRLHQEGIRVERRARP